MARECFIDNVNIYIAQMVIFPPAVYVWVQQMYYAVRVGVKMCEA